MSIRTRLMDYHIHSTQSYDGKSSIFESCQKALELGIAEIGFSEHVDFDPVDWGFGFFDYDRYTSQIRRTREFFKDKIVIRQGIEIDYQHSFEEEIKVWLRKKQFDFTIGSVHYLNHVIINPQTAEGEELEERYNAYLKEVSRSIESGLFDVVGHFDLMGRYIGNRLSELEDFNHRKKMKRILRRIKEKRIFLEVNTKALREGYGDTIPCRKIINQYIEDGGKLISLGSDAHSTKEIGSGIKEVLDFLSQYTERQVELLFERKESQ